MPRAGLCEGSEVGENLLAGDSRYASSSDLFFPQMAGGGVDGVDEQRGSGNGGASLNADGHGDGEY